MTRQRVLILNLIVAAIALTAVCYSCSFKSEKQQSTATVMEGAGPSLNDTVDSVTDGDWIYRTVRDNLTDKPTFYAECPSSMAKHLTDEQNEDVDMELKITLCRTPGEPDKAILTVKQGVFNINTNKANIKVRFDDGPVENYTCSVNDEYLSRGLCIDDPNRFISHLQQADSCRIGTSYLYDGELIFTHQLSGLKW